MDLFASRVSSSCIFLLETRPIQHRQRCISGITGTQNGLCVPTLLADRSGSKGFNRQGYLDSYNTSMTCSTMVSTVSTNVNRVFTSFAPSRNSLTDSNREIHPFVAKRNFEFLPWTVSGKSYLQKAFQRTLPLLSEVKRSGGNYHYESSWRKWYNWCSKRKLIPLTVL